MCVREYEFNNDLTENACFVTFHIFSLLLKFRGKNNINQFAENVFWIPYRVLLYHGLRKSFFFALLSTSFHHYLDTMGIIPMGIDRIHVVLWKFKFNVKRMFSVVCIDRTRSKEMWNDTLVARKNCEKKNENIKKISRWNQSGGKRFCVVFFHTPLNFFYLYTHKGAKKRTRETKTMEYIFEERNN